MRTISSQLTIILLLGYLLLSTVETVEACDVFPIISPQAMVKNADIIVRATATEFIDKEGVNFKFTEILKGINVPTTITITGSLEKRDDFNKGNVPYGHVRSSGHGPCFAYEYKKGGEFLLFLKKEKGELTPYWSPLAPANEQLRSDNDEWVKWVKTHLKWLENASELEKLELSFELMKKATDWNLNDDAMWRYRFIDSNQEKLQRLAKHFELLGYKNVKISKLKNGEDLEEFELEVEKLEKHSPKTMTQRNKEFRTLANAFGIRKYNEWLTSLF